MPLVVNQCARRFGRIVRFATIEIQPQAFFNAIDLQFIQRLKQLLPVIVSNVAHLYHDINIHTAALQ